jgi:hypothetical protein
LQEDQVTDVPGWRISFCPIMALSQDQSMSKPLWPWPLLAGILWLGTCSPAAAQLKRLKTPADFAENQELLNRSHRPLRETLEDVRDVEALLRDRLQKARDLHNLQDLAQRLLNDPAALEELKKNLNPGDLERLKDKLLRGQNISADPALGRLLGQEKAKEFLSDKEKEMLARWLTSHPELAAKLLAGQDSRPGNDPPGASSPDAPPLGGGISPAPTPGPTSEQSPWAQFKEESSSWVRQQIVDLKDDLKDLFDADNASERKDSWLGRLGRLDTKNGIPNFTERARQLARYLPMDRVRNEVGEVLRGIRLPNLGGNLPRSSGSTWKAGAVLLWFVLLAAVAFALWKSLGWYRDQVLGKTRSWQLGPWPVHPAQIRTREQLVRAFEHLALLLLGPAARNWHHLQIAERMGEDTEERRDAAARLARLYEQARYAPEDEPLPEDDLACARGDLCHLAGVAAA